MKKTFYCNYYKYIHFSLWIKQFVFLPMKTCSGGGEAADGADSKVLNNNIFNFFIWI